jgi:hypothetical protein
VRERVRREKAELGGCSPRGEQRRRSEFDGGEIAATSAAALRARNCGEGLERGRGRVRRPLNRRGRSLGCVRTEAERRRGSRSGRCGPSPIRPEVGDDRWVPPAGPTGQRAGKRAGALRVVLLLGWRGWAAAHSGMRGEGRGAGALGRESAQVRALPFSFFFKFSCSKTKQNKHQQNK